MGNCMKTCWVPRKLRLCRRSSKTKKATIVLLIIGLDNAGKSLIVNRIAGDNDENTIPTVGFRRMSLKYRKHLVRVYDLGGAPQIRGIWPKYYADVHGLIYVVDSGDTSRLPENKAVLEEVLAHRHVSGKPLLLLANKQDLSGAIDEIDLVETLDIERVANETRCPTRVETCSCVPPRDKCQQGVSGIKSGYRWLLESIIKNYSTLDERISREARVDRSNGVGVRDRTVDTSNSRQSSIASIRSNPFRPIRELLSNRDREALVDEKERNDPEKSRRKVFPFPLRNKTAPLPFGTTLVDQSDARHLEMAPPSSSAIARVIRVQSVEIHRERGDEISLRPIDLESDFQYRSRHRIGNDRDRPFTAPDNRSNRNENSNSHYR